MMIHDFYNFRGFADMLFTYSSDCRSGSALIGSSPWRPPIGPSPCQPYRPRPLSALSVLAAIPSPYRPLSPYQPIGSYRPQPLSAIGPGP